MASCSVQTRFKSRPWQANWNGMSTFPTPQTIRCFLKSNKTSWKPNPKKILSTLLRDGLQWQKLMIWQEEFLLLLAVMATQVIQAFTHRLIPSPTIVRRHFHNLWMLRKLPSLRTHSCMNSGRPCTAPALAGLTQLVADSQQDWRMRMVSSARSTTWCSFLLQQVSSEDQETTKDKAQLAGGLELQML